MTSIDLMCVLMRLQRLLHRERCSDTARDLRAGPDVGLCEQNVRAYLRRLDIGTING